jgi:hypothetical protein
VQVPRQITSAIGDIRRISESMQALPKMVDNLAAIRRHAESLDEDVAKMRAAVEEINAKVDDVEDTLHPFRRRARD